MEQTTHLSNPSGSDWAPNLDNIPETNIFVRTLQDGRKFLHNNGVVTPIAVNDSCEQIVGAYVKNLPITPNGGVIVEKISKHIVHPDFEVLDKPLFVVDSIPNEVYVYPLDAEKIIGSAADVQVKECGETAFKPDLSEFVSDLRTVKSVHVLPANPKFWAGTGLEIPEGAKTAMLEHDSGVSETKHDGGTIWPVNGIGNERTYVESIGNDTDYKEKIHDESISSNRHPFRGIRSGGIGHISNMQAMLAIAALGMSPASSGGQGFAAASPFDNFKLDDIPSHLNPPNFPGYNSGFKKTKKYSPGHGSNKAVTFDKKKKAAKTAAKSKRINRK